MVLTYNQEKTLPKTLDSILSQDFPADAYEVIVGEDKSTDGTAQLLKEYAARFPQIRALYNPQNLGIIKNFLNIMAHCRGKYVMGCAGDDYWLAGKMRFQFDFMEKNPAISMIYGKWLFQYEGQICPSSAMPIRESFEALVKHGNCICAPSACWRREFWAGFERDIQLEKRGWFCEDFPLWLYLARHGKIKYIPQDFCVYNIAPDSASVSDNEAKNRDLRAQIYDIQLFFAEKYAPELLPEIAQIILKKESGN